MNSKGSRTEEQRNKEEREQTENEQQGGRLQQNRTLNYMKRNWTRHAKLEGRQRNTLTVKPVRCWEDMHRERERAHRLAHFAFGALYPLYLLLSSPIPHHPHPQVSPVRPGIRWLGKKARG